jgi:nitrogen fixation protein NifU and related proteins
MLYSEKVMSHFKKPQNMGEMKNPDGVGKAGNMVCGDVMFLYIKVVKNKKGQEIIKDIKFQTLGCVAAIANSSMITKIAKGKTIEEALKIDRKQIVESLGGLPKVKHHCSVLSSDALAEAVYDYYSKNKRPIPESLEKLHKIINTRNQEVSHLHEEN